jgi:hypothetical protein
MVELADGKLPWAGKIEEETIGIKTNIEMAELLK